MKICDVCGSISIASTCRKCTAMLDEIERMHVIVTTLERKRCARCERPGELCECIDPTKDDNLPF